MRSSKRYSNATITKRVDHDGGRHRTLRHDPEPAFCRVCGAVWANRRWSMPEKPEATVAEAAHPKAHGVTAAGRSTICPACRKQQDGLPEGYVHLEGAYFKQHSVEIEHMLRNEAARASDTNPLARILSWERISDAALTISTTTDHLALRLGRALEGAFGGDARITFSHENKLTRVRWRRD